MQVHQNELPRHPLPHIPQPQQPQVQLPTVYVYEKQRWEYRVVSKDVADEAPLSEDELNALNHELLIRLHESGVAAPSGTDVRGKYAIRCAITNHRSRREDFDILIEEVLKLGDALVEENQAAVS